MSVEIIIIEEEITIEEEEIEMTNTYVFSRPDNSMVIRSPDNGNFPWDNVNNQPIDIFGLTGRIWKADGSPIPAPYVAPVPTPGQLYTNAINSGVNVTWTTSTSLNGTYAVDQNSQFFITSETVSTLKNGKMTNGANTRMWQDMSGGLHSMNMTQFGLFATAVAQYVDACQMAMATANTMPNNNITITG